MTGTAPYDPETARRILKDRADALARPLEVEKRAEMIGIVAFVVGNERYGLQLTQVVGIELLPQLAPVPGTPVFWAGLANVHGTLYPVLDLRQYLGLSSPPTTGERKLVLVSAAGVRAGLLADDVADVSWIPRDDIAPPPTGRRGRHLGLRGVTSDLIAVLDLKLLLADQELVVNHDVS